VWTGNLFFDQDIKLFPQVEIFKLQEDLYFEFRAFELIEVKLLVDIRIVHFLNANSIIQIFLSFIVKGLIGYIGNFIPTLIFSNFSRDLGFLSGW